MCPQTPPSTVSYKAKRKREIERNRLRAASYRERQYQNSENLNSQCVVSLSNLNVCAESFQPAGSVVNKKQSVASFSPNLTAHANGQTLHQLSPPGHCQRDNFVAMSPCLSPQILPSMTPQSKTTTNAPTPVSVSSPISAPLANLQSSSGGLVINKLEMQGNMPIG